MKVVLTFQSAQKRMLEGKLMDLLFASKQMEKFIINFILNLYHIVFA